MRFVFFCCVALCLLATHPALWAADTASLESLKSQARAAYDEGDFARSAELSKSYYAALRNEHGRREDSELATAALNAGNAFQKAGDEKTGLIYTSTACQIAIRVYGEQSVRAGTCMIFLTEAEAAANQIPEATAWAYKAIAIIEKTMPPEQLAAAKFHLGEVFRDAKALSIAAHFFESAARMYRSSQLNIPNYLSRSLTELAQSQLGINQLPAAIRTLEEAITVEPEVPNISANKASIAYLLSDCYQRIGEYDRSIQLLKSVGAALKGVGANGHTSQDEILLQIAERESNSGGSSEAIATLQEVIQHTNGANDAAARHHAVQALTLSGHIYSNRHEYSLAEQSFGHAIDMVDTDANNTAGRTEALREMGFFLLRRGRYAEARKRLDEALTMVEASTPESTEEALILGELSVALANSNDCEAALPMLQKASTIYFKRDSHSAEFMGSLKQLSFCTEGEAMRARLMNAALRLQLQIEGVVTSGFLTDLAGEYEKERRFKAAESTARHALKLDPTNDVAMGIVANCLTKAGRFPAAIASLRAAASIASAEYGDDSINFAGRQFNLGRTLLESGNRQSARLAFIVSATAYSAHATALLKSLSMGEQRQLILGQTAVQTSGLLSTCCENQTLTTAYQLILPWKGLLVSGLRREAMIATKMSGAADEAKVARWKTLRTELSILASARASMASAQWTKEADTLTNQKESVERDILGSDEVLTVDPAISVQTLQHALRDDEVFVDIYKFENFSVDSRSATKYAAIVTGAKTDPVYVDLGASRDIDDAMLGWLSSLRLESSESWQRLEELVWGTIRKAFPAGLRKVSVSADGELVKLPWHQIVNGRNADHLAIVEVDSARSLIRARSNAAAIRASNLLMVGDLDYDAGITNDAAGLPKPFAPLKWAALESASIVDIASESHLPSIWLAKDKATKSAVLTQLSQSSHIHFATHGYANGQAERGLSGRGWVIGSNSSFTRDPLIDSGLALSGANVRDRLTFETNGLLTAEEILDADLNGAKLVVLSACDTALGLNTPSQGVMGLRSALSAAGARTVLMSLWSVDDEATKILMTRFYQGLWAGQLSVVDALHAAQREVQADARFRAPLFWGGWVVVDAL